MKKRFTYTDEDIEAMLGTPKKPIVVKKGKKAKASAVVKKGKNNETKTTSADH